MIFLQPSRNDAIFIVNGIAVFFFLLLSTVSCDQYSDNRGVYGQSDPYDAREASTYSIHSYLSQHIHTCREITEAHLARIEAHNPVMNSMIALNPKALLEADAKDNFLKEGNMTGPLFCVPILLKDNFDTIDMNTTGASLALRNSRPTANAPVVTALIIAGAIILGKTNLHEMALEGLSVSSLGGQTINPYDHSRTPGGSSGGTGAAIAASFAVFGTGTDTVNSLRSPASANSLFSIRPTRGLLSRNGVIPISGTQDAVGPIARNLDDLAIALTVMASVGRDKDDTATEDIPASLLGYDYAAAARGGKIRGKRFGLIEGFFNHTASNETDPVNDVMDEMIASLLTAGATIIPIMNPIYDSPQILANCDTQTHEYREELNKYLARPSLQGTHPESFEELYNSDDAFVIPHQHPYIRTAFTTSTTNASYTKIQTNIKNLRQVIEETFSFHNLDALIYPQQSNLVVKIGAPNQYGRNGIMAAVTGFPVLTVPAGFSEVTPDAPLGVPVGMEILGLKWTEAELLRLAKAIAEVRPVRRPPRSTDTLVARWQQRYVEVPPILPNPANVPEAYDSRGSLR